MINLHNDLSRIALSDKIKSCHSLKTKLKNLDFWTSLAPNLSIDSTDPPLDAISFEDAKLDEISHRLHQEGYLQLSPLFTPRQYDPIKKGIEALGEVGLPPVFIYAFDQPWHIFSRLSPLISHFLGKPFSLLPNFWAWNIPLKAGASGWPPHQDCQARTRFPDGEGGELLMSLSLWIPLTDATPDNGCMSVLPRTIENRHQPKISEPEQIDLDEGIPLPAVAGSVLGWPQDLYHWSNAVTEKAIEENQVPRMSLSLEFQNPAFAPLQTPLLDIGKPPPFEQRLSLIAAQFDKYQHMEKLDFDASDLGY